jgi:hypothetical protein
MVTISATERGFLSRMSASGRRLSGVNRRGELPLAGFRLGQSGEFVRVGQWNDGIVDRSGDAAGVPRYVYAELGRALLRALTAALRGDSGPALRRVFHARYLCAYIASTRRSRRAAAASHTGLRRPWRAATER